MLRSESSDCAPIVHSPTIDPASSFFLPECVPEPQRLVSRPSDDRFAGRAHGEVEDTVRVAREADDLCHARILPHHDLILGVAVRAHDLVGVLGPREVANLRSGVDFLHQQPRHRVPELDAPISGSTAGGQEAALVGGPRDCFHCGGVLAELPQWCFGQLIPD